MKQASRLLIAAVFALATVAGIAAVGAAALATMDDVEYVEPEPVSR